MSKPELTLETISTCDKCIRCDGSGQILDARGIGGTTHCEACAGKGVIPLGKNYSEVIAFLAREIIKTNKRLDEVAEDAEYGAQHALTGEPLF